MRGASALQSVLDQVHGQRLRVFIVWEPVIWTDMGPPSGSVLSRTSDSRTVHFRDQLLLSKKLVQEWSRSGVRAEAECGSDPGAIIWDSVALPVVEHVEQVHAKLVDAMRDGH